MASNSFQSRVVRLTVKRDEKVLYALEFSKQTIMIGRSRGADVPLNDDQASRQHAVINVRSDGVVTVSDSGSTNGTFLNGNLCRDDALKTGDVIQIGSTNIHVEVVEETEQTGHFEATTKSGTQARRRRREDRTGDASEAVEQREAAEEAPGDQVSETSSEVLPPEQLDPAILQLKVEQEIDKNLRKPDFKGRQVELPREVIRFRAPTVLTMREREVVSRVEVSAAGILPRKRVLQISMSWFDDVLKVAHYGSGRTIWIGEDLRNEFVLPCDNLPGSFLFIKTKRKFNYLYFTSDMVGDVEMAGQVRSLQDLKTGARVIKSKLYTFYEAKIDFSMRVRITLGYTSFFIQSVPRVKAIPFVPFKRVDWEGLKIAVLTAILFLLMFGGLNQIPVQSGELDNQMPDSRVAKLILYTPEEPLKIPANKLPRGLTEEPEQREGAGGAPPGQMGAGKRRTEKPLAARQTIDDKSIVAEDPIFKSLLTRRGAVGKGVDRVKGALGELKAEKGDRTGGFLDVPGKGMNKRGFGSGGGGLPNSVGTGLNVHLGGGSGTGEKGTGLDQISKHRVIEIIPAVEEVEMVGALDREEIQKVVQDNMNQVKYCYDRELILHPKLQGKIIVGWEIGVAGMVKSTRLVKSTLGNPSVEQCVLRVIEKWKFPSPRGGGVVVVKSYPFSFRTINN